MKLSHNMLVAIYTKNLEKAILSHTEEVVEFLANKGIRLTVEKTLYEAFPIDIKLKCDETFDEGHNVHADLFLSIGGDGTFLGSVKYVKDTGTPILGVNCGRLGFLANISYDEFMKSIDSIISGRYKLEQRRLLQVKVEGYDLGDFSYVLNDVCVQKTDRSSIIKIHVYIGDKFLTTYWADGLIMASPTGSTAYSLSGGGPVLSPSCRNVILTPISPHNFTLRPMVLTDDEVVRMKVDSRSGDFIMSMDSKSHLLPSESEVMVQADGKYINMVVLEGYNYYETLRTKLMWGEDRRNLEEKDKEC